MALQSKSLFLYGFTIDSSNDAIDFKTSGISPEINATLKHGFYSLSSLLLEIARAMNAADPTRVYTATANRTFAGGTENRVTIATNFTYLTLLFGTGSRVTSSVASTIGFANTDQTTLTSYQGTLTAGTALVTEWYGFNWQPPQLFRRNFGSVNVTASGQKESIVFALQEFMEVDFRYEPYAKCISEWNPLIDWMIQQRVFDFTPEILLPTIFYEVTLEKSVEDGKGLAFRMKEMLPQYPFTYTTGAMTFRRRT